jgi:phospholipase/lecithinase/hemolysin
MLVWIIALIDIAAFLGGIALSYVDAIGFAAATAGAVFVVVVVTFLGLLSIAQNIKDAIAAAFVVVYFTMILLIVFANVGNEAGADSLLRQIISNFTTLTGVVVGSYFAAVAVQTVSNNRLGPAKGPQPDEVPSLMSNTFEGSGGDTVAATSGT